MIRHIQGRRRMPVAALALLLMGTAAGCAGGPRPGRPQPPAPPAAVAATGHQGVILGTLDDLARQDLAAGPRRAAR